MGRLHLNLVLRLALTALVATQSGCGLYHDVKDLVHSAKEKVEEKPKATAQEPEPEHEGALLDNKVTALRVQEALQKEGAEFRQVQVKGDAEGVVMTGSVRSAAARTRAEEIARGVHRAMKLKNELKVER